MPRRVSRRAVCATNKSFQRNFLPLTHYWLYRIGQGKHYLTGLQGMAKMNLLLILIQFVKRLAGYTKLDTSGHDRAGANVIGI